MYINWLQKKLDNIYKIHLSFKMGLNEKKLHTLHQGMTIFVFKCQYMWPTKTNLENITNLEILPYLLHFSKS